MFPAHSQKIDYDERVPGEEEESQGSVPDDPYGLESGVVGDDSGFSDDVSGSSGDEEQAEKESVPGAPRAPKGWANGTRMRNVPALSSSRARAREINAAFAAEPRVEVLIPQAPDLDEYLARWGMNEMARVRFCRSYATFKAAQIRTTFTIPTKQLLLKRTEAVQDMEQLANAAGAQLGGKKSKTK